MDNNSQQEQMMQLAIVGAAYIAAGKDLQAGLLLALAALQNDQQAIQLIQPILQQANPQELALVGAQIIQQVQSAQEGQAVQQAAKGAKLAYLHTLRTGCPEGYEPQYYKKGGKTCKACAKIAKAKKVAEDKCGGKTVKRHQSGGEFTSGLQYFYESEPRRSLATSALSKALGKLITKRVATNS